MEDDLLHYYERELTFIREMGADFARKYPKIAGRLLLEAEKCEDPHTERLLEAFALLSGRIHKKIDDDFPEITESLLNILYPHYVSPIPSMSIVRFEAGKTIPPTGYLIQKQTPLYSKPVGGFPCQFSTSYPVTLWPVDVASAGLHDPKHAVPNGQQAILIRLKTRNNLSFSQIEWNETRFFLNGPAQHVFHLYELLFNNRCHIECESRNRNGNLEMFALGPEAIQPVGFSADEAMLPYPARSFPGYLLLFEYFCFPEKFLFFDLKGLERLRKRDLDDKLDIWIYLDRVAKSTLLITPETFCLHATPAVNLFRRIAEPIAIEEKKTEYHVIPDVRRTAATEVFSVERVLSSSTSGEKETEFKPFYSIWHHRADEDDPSRKAFWLCHRRPSGKKDDNGTEIFLSFSNWDFSHASPEIDTAMVETICTNRDLPARLPFGDPSGDFEMEIAAPISRIHCLVKPTPTRRSSLGGALQWRLISHLSLNYMSLVHGGEDALKEILKLYDFDNSPSTRQQINGLISLKSEYLTKRIGQSFCRGVQVTVEFDEEKYVGTGLYLFASILERFLGEYVSINSFSQLVAKTLQRKEPLKTWPARNGNRVLL